MNNRNLQKSKDKKFDEFYTRYEDIEKEIDAYLDYNPTLFKDKTVLLPCDDPEWSNFTRYFSQRFELLGLKKLISTSYALESKKYKDGYQISLFEEEDPQFDLNLTKTKGKIFTLTKKDKPVNIKDLKWKYLKGDGDFRSDEVMKLRDEADIIITNPPFSLYREFLNWLMESNKQFLIIANKNSVHNKETFPLFKNNKIWAGKTEWSGGLWFETRNKDDVDKIVDGVPMKNVPAVWVTNIEHGRRHEPFIPMSMEDNLKYNEKFKKKLQKEYGVEYYPKYVNYDAIEVLLTEAIPKDYKGYMGVPISFLDKYNPDQFEIIGSSGELGKPMKDIASKGEYEQGGPAFYTKEGDPNYKYKRIYSRIIIKWKDI